GGRGCRPPCAQRRAWGSSCLDLGPGRDRRLVSAPDVWAPDRGRCHTAARLTRLTAPAAVSVRQRATADRPGGLGSAPGSRLLAVAPAQRGGLVDVCPLYSARRPEWPSAGDPSPTRACWGGGSPWPGV